MPPFSSLLYFFGETFSSLEHRNFVKAQKETNIRNTLSTRIGHFCYLVFFCSISVSYTHPHTQEYLTNSIRTLVMFSNVSLNVLLMYKFEFVLFCFICSFLYASFHTLFTSFASSNMYTYNIYNILTLNTTESAFTGRTHRILRHCSRSTTRGHASPIPLYYLSRLRT